MPEPLPTKALRVLVLELTEGSSRWQTGSFGALTILALQFRQVDGYAPAAVESVAHYDTGTGMHERGIMIIIQALPY